MVVKTRSYYQEKQRVTSSEAVAAAASEIYEADADAVCITTSAHGRRGRRGRRVKITTPSFVEANTRTYKIYTPTRKPRQAALAAEAEAEAAEVLVGFQEEELEQEQYVYSPRSEDESDTLSAPASASVNHTCLNPMRPITKYMYRITAYNMKQTSHYKTAYIIYDNTSRLFHVYSIVSNKLSNEAEDADTFVPSPITCRNLPEPCNTIQTKYTTYISEMAMNYIMTMIIPSREYDYYVQDDILGVVIQDDEFRKIVFSTDSSFYDIEGLLHDKSSTETITGFKTFMLVPVRNFWYDPAAGYVTTTAESALSYGGDNRYTSDIINSVLMILTQSN